MFKLSDPQLWGSAGEVPETGPAAFLYIPDES